MIFILLFSYWYAYAPFERHAKGFPKSYRLAVDQNFTDNISGLLTWGNLSFVKNVGWISWIRQLHGCDIMEGHKSSLRYRRLAKLKSFWNLCNLIMFFGIPPKSMKTLESYQSLGILAIFPESWRDSVTFRISCLKIQSLKFAHFFYFHFLCKLVTQRVLT